MDDWFTEGEKQRISEFVSTPAYERRPELLIPETED
jgi:hypothetical protein